MFFLTEFYCSLNRVLSNIFVSLKVIERNRVLENQKFLAMLVNESGQSLYDQYSKYSLISLQTELKFIRSLGIVDVFQTDELYLAEEKEMGKTYKG